ncbi:MAG: tRNA (adenosine(37)-N6)-threonylcarbamoyltransferase complex dimerization subunit type 1 TsaB [Gammaproteobacteria bacterium]|nr:tRNA (adenosine(37)-N6)-threonylcarbamoyltransferase complex dimerization subunit type 1 TsaB [Gammaproteobacteria bacterium]
MKLLAIETSTEACSAALWIEGEISERYQLAPREHTRLILPMAEALLDEAGVSLNQLDALAFGRGPGAFTGVRIATSVIQGIAFAADLPVIPVSSLAVLAQGAYREQRQAQVITAIDARMNELYWACYKVNENGLMCLQGKEHVIVAELAPLPKHGSWFGVGSGWQTYAEPLQGRMNELLTGFEGARYPRAEDLALLAQAAYLRNETVNSEQALPVYIRDDVAKVKAI